MTERPPAAPSKSAVRWQWIRHHLTSILSTVVDYAVMVGCVELLHLRPVPATVFGALVGATTNFTVNRTFTYHATKTAVAGHLWRYALVSVTSLALNAGGEELFNGVLRMHYLLARVITSVIVSNAWNYPMQRFFVFSRRTST
ncbi:MAG TPA: GtrA family protein [Polyangia bacterium]|nr:GtrA family protein [Polyangia bacterium]